MVRLDYKCEEYLKQAMINESLVSYFYKNCLQRKFNKWIFVVIYYCTLHYLNALLIYKEITPPKKHTSYGGGFDENSVIDLAEQNLSTQKNNITDSATGAFAQLLEWSYIVRYKTNWNALNKSAVEAALELLKLTKLIVLNEIGYRPKNNGANIIIVKANVQFLNQLQQEVNH